MALALVALGATAQNLNIKARGGMEKLKAVNTMRMTGKMSMSGMEIPMVIEMKRPSSVRTEMTIQGMTGVSAYDGKAGWSLMPFQGKKDPEPMGEARLKDIADQADFDGPLVDYKEKGHKLELLGKEPVEGTDAYKLRITFKNGDTHTIYLDADSFLEIKTEFKRTINGTEMEAESEIGDYKEVQGLMVPFSTRGGLKGSAQKQAMVVEKVEINPPIDDARFKMPEVKPPEAPKPAEKKPPQS
jgi:hypothetical protein